MTKWLVLITVALFVVLVALQLVQKKSQDDISLSPQTIHSEPIGVLLPQGASNYAGTDMLAKEEYFPVSQSLAPAPAAMKTDENTELSMYYLKQIKQDQKKLIKEQMKMLQAAMKNFKKK
ncbi:MAG: hypothetical protein A2021_08300 [Elusimicrobia bacterium GWF2_52_66]|nr:MAG: hypothetical protein A2X33_04365 [Elusimicrobia bacterium GWA2_51_34]OGR88470.1 MAG: hypothetical protein A2021_08300 [Elusimicrobia bacterium GWF2_52_66]HAF95949.1 hypothetical protein [Elusimicrobiota bacterium]HCE97534.1 hypothetical protein [Elusimicrobiota bacterium]